MARGRRRRGSGSFETLPNGKVRVFFSGGLGPDGKRVRQTKTFATRNDAEWWLREAKRQGKAPDTGETVAEYLERWLASKRKIRDSTRLQYENHVRVHLIPHLGAIPVSQLQRRHVEEFVVNREQHVAKSTGRPLTAATVGKLVTTLRSALEAGVPRDLPDNVAAKVETPRVERRLVQAMTVADARAILGAFRGTWLDTLVRFMLGSGVRIGEALALDQMDVQDGFVRLRKSKTTLRAVSVTEDGMAALREAVRAAPRRGDHEPVFFAPRANRQGVRDRLDRNSVNHAFTRILKDNGLPHLSPHGLRHGTATLMLTFGAPMQAIADQLGHRNPGLTMRTYAHVDPSLVDRALDRLDEAVSDR